MVKYCEYQKVRYELHIKEMGYRPEAYIVADALMYADDKCIVDILNMNLRLEGLFKEDIDDLWSKSETVFFDESRILEFTAGSPVKALVMLTRVLKQVNGWRVFQGTVSLFSEVVSSDVEAWQMRAGSQALLVSL